MDLRIPLCRARKPQKSCGLRVKRIPPRVALQAQSTGVSEKPQLASRRQKHGARLRRTRNVSKRRIGRGGSSDERGIERESWHEQRRGVESSLELNTSPCRARRENQRNGTREGRDGEATSVVRLPGGGGRALKGEGEGRRWET